MLMADETVSAEVGPLLSPLMSSGVVIAEHSSTKRVIRAILAVRLS